MAVWCRQTVDGEPAEPYVIAPHFDGQTDSELLAAKAAGAHDKGWDVEFIGPKAFTATKLRWEQASVCVREFWAD
jgi:hypothetical protein